jgi:hypothetical protein
MAFYRTHLSKPPLGTDGGIHDSIIRDLIFTQDYGAVELT